MRSIRPHTNPAVQGNGAPDALSNRGKEKMFPGALRRCKTLLAIAMLSGATGLAHADCWEEAGREYSIAPALLYAIAEQESNFDPRAIGRNSNGSRDIGLMQINSMHLPALAKKGITEKMLLNDSCKALKVGAGILAGFMRQFGYSWEAVGAYNAGAATDSGAAARRMRYARQVAERYRRVTASAGPGGPALRRLPPMAMPKIKTTPIGRTAAPVKVIPLRNKAVPMASVIPTVKAMPIISSVPAIPGIELPAAALPTAGMPMFWPNKTNRV